MTASAVVFLDIVGMLSFATGLVVAARMPLTRLGGYERQVRILLMITMTVYAFVGVSNILEHSGVTAALDAYEDYAEILFIPAMAYLVYTAGLALQVQQLTDAEEGLRAEHELLTGVVETSPSGVMRIDAGGAIVFANDRARALLGLQRDPSGGSWTLPEGIVCVSAIPGERLLDLVRLADGVVLEDRLCYLELGEARRAISVSARPYGGGEAGRGSVVSVTDVTEREEARRRLVRAQAEYRLDLERTVDERTADLLEMNRELESANRVKRSFVANVSHELRTPLNSIIGFTDLLIQELPGPVNAEQSKQLTMVRDSATHLLMLVNDLLDFERMEAGQRLTAVAETPLCPLLDRLVHSIEPLADEAGVALVLECETAAVLQTDQGMLGQIVRNLVSNAIKFTDPGGTVTVRATEDAEGVAIAVSDTGIGIAEEDRDRVFKPFVQLDTPNRIKPPGTGLGLAISRELAGLLGGALTLESTPGEGSTFHLRLPLVIPAETEDA
ncbi:MAG: ATP-binding protein [Anaerosomatales bacterium]|nr:ATP-binding protein [Anaerosomatales bacterium]